MASFIRRSIPAILVFLLNAGLQISGYQNLTLAVVLWSLMVPAAGFAVWPWIKRIRIGLEAPNSELLEALEARDRWREHFEAKQSEVRKLNKVREQQLEKLREVEQERKQLQVGKDALTEELEEARANASRLYTPTVEQEDSQAVIERLKRESEQLRAERDGQLRVRCLQLSDELDKFVKERNRNDPQRNIEHADATDAEIYRHTQTMMRYDQETRNQYRDQLKGKVDMLRADLQRLDWWKPKKDVESLEDPSHLDDVQGISNYLRWIGHGFPI